MRPVRMADNLTTCAIVMKSGNLNFLELSGQIQACNGTDLPLNWDRIIFNATKAASFLYFYVFPW
jgi:hypothetical protein